MQFFCVLFHLVRVVLKFDSRIVTNETITNGDQCLLQSLRHAVKVTRSMLFVP